MQHGCRWRGLPNRGVLVATMPRRHSIEWFRLAAGVGALLLTAGCSSQFSTAAQCQSPPLAMEEALRALSADDEARLLAAVEEGFTRVLQWLAAADSWWDDVRSIRIGAGVTAAVHKTKQLPGFATRAHLVVAVFESATEQELKLLIEASPDCLKLKFDPVLEAIEIFQVFQGGQARLMRTSTRPALMGLISARECDSVQGVLRRLPDQRWIQASVGLQSLYLKEHVQGRPALETLAALPPTSGRIRAFDQTSGYVLEPLDEEAARGAPGRWRVHYLLQSEAGGGLPNWAAEKGVAKAITDWFYTASKQLKTMRGA